MPRKLRGDNGLAPPARAETLPRKANKKAVSKTVVTSTKNTRARSLSRLQAQASQVSSPNAPDDDDVVVVSATNYPPVVTPSGTGRRKNSAAHSNFNSVSVRSSSRGTRAPNSYVPPSVYRNPKRNRQQVTNNVNENNVLTTTDIANSLTNELHSDFNWNITEEVLQQFPLVSNSDCSEPSDFPAVPPTPILPTSVSSSTSSSITITKGEVQNGSYHGMPCVAALECQSDFSDICATRSPSEVRFDLNRKLENDSACTNSNNSSSLSLPEFRKPSSSSLGESSDLFKHLTATSATSASLPKDMSTNATTNSDINDYGKKEENVNAYAMDAVVHSFVPETNDSSGEKQINTSFNENDSDDLASLIVLDDTSFHNSADQVENYPKCSSSVFYNIEGSSRINETVMKTEAYTGLTDSIPSQFLTSINHPDLSQQSLAPTKARSKGNKTAKNSKKSKNCGVMTQVKNIQQQPETYVILGTRRQKGRKKSAVSNSNTKIAAIINNAEAESSNFDCDKIITLSELQNEYNKDGGENPKTDRDLEYILTGKAINEEFSDLGIEQPNAIIALEVVDPSLHKGTNHLQIPELGIRKRGRKSCSDTDTASETEKIELEKANIKFLPPASKRCKETGKGKHDENITNDGIQTESMPAFASSNLNGAVNQLNRVDGTGATSEGDNSNNVKETETTMYKVETTNTIKPTIKNAKMTKVSKDKEGNNPIETERRVTLKSTLKGSKKKSDVQKKSVPVKGKGRGRPRTIIEDLEHCIESIGLDNSANTDSKTKGRPRSSMMDNPQSNETLIQKNQSELGNDQKKSTARSRSGTITEQHEPTSDTLKTLDSNEIAVTRNKKEVGRKGKGSLQTSMPVLQLQPRLRSPTPPAMLEDELPDIPTYSSTDPIIPVVKSQDQNASQYQHQSQVESQNPNKSGVINTVDGKVKKKSQNNVISKSTATSAKTPKILKKKAPDATVKHPQKQKSKSLIKAVKTSDNNETVNEGESSANANNLKTRWLWYYNQEHKNILYKDGAFLALRDDLNKSGDIYLWRILKEYKMLRKFIPIEIDGRRCHYGVDEFKKFQMDDAFVCTYQPVIFTMVVDSPKYQIGIYYNTVENLQLLAYFPSTNNLFTQFGAFLRHMVIRAMTDDDQIKPEKNIHGGTTQSAVEVIETHVGRILQEIMFRNHWPRETMMCLLEYPSINKTRTKVNKTLNCISCSKLGKIAPSAFKLLFHGKCYDASTLVLTNKEGPPIPIDDIQFCHGCPIILRSLHRLIHYKYWVFVAIRMQLQQLYRSLKPGQSYEARKVFDFIVGDFEWVNSMFYEFQATLGEGTQAIEKTDRQIKQMERKGKGNVKSEPGLGEQSKKVGRPRLNSSASSEHVSKTPVGKRVKKVKRNVKRESNDFSSNEVVTDVKPKLTTSSSNTKTDTDGVHCEFPTEINAHLIPTVTKRDLDYSTVKYESGAITSNPDFSSSQDSLMETSVKLDCTVVAGKMKKSKDKLDYTNSTMKTKISSSNSKNKKNEIMTGPGSTEKAKQIEENFQNAILRAALPPLSEAPCSNSGSSGSESETEADQPESSSSSSAFLKSEETAK